MAWRALTIALLLASACPPPRVSNALIADAERRDGPGKTVQSRGGNRLGSPMQVADCQALPGIDGSRARIRRLSPHLARGFGLPIATRFEPASTSPAARATFRLRC